MRDGLLSGCGVQQVGLPGYPEGHPRIASATLAAALAEKLGARRGAGLGAYVVTQFSFAPNRIVEYCADLARRAPRCAGLRRPAGPTSPRTLLRYAQRCGVGASLRALQAQGMGAVRLFTNVDPTDSADRAGAPHASTGSRQQRRRRAPLQLRRRRHHRPLDERANQGWRPLRGGRPPRRLWLALLAAAALGEAASAKDSMAQHLRVQGGRRPTAVREPGFVGGAPVGQWPGGGHEGWPCETGWPWGRRGLALGARGAAWGYRLGRSGGSSCRWSITRVSCGLRGGC